MLLVRHIPFAYWRQAVLEGFFKISKPSDFNDPHDCVGTCYGKPRYEVMDAFARASRSELLNTEECVRLQIEGKLNRREVLQSRCDKLAMWMNGYLSERSTFDKSIRLLCFSDPEKIAGTNSETLMWAHYADKGHGVRLWVDVESDSGFRRVELRGVDYKDEVPQFDLRMMNSWPLDDELMKFYHRVVTTKGTAWEYEHEYRLIMSPRSTPGIISRDKDGRTLDFIALPIEDIKRVDFGPLVPASYLDQVRVVRVVRPDLVFYRARLNASMYRYQYEEIIA